MTTASFNHRGRDYRFDFPNEDCVQLKQIEETQTFPELRLLETIEDARIKGVYLDVGANIGTHSVYFNHYCPCSDVIAIEGCWPFFECLQDNLRANAFGQKPFSVLKAMSYRCGYGKMKNGGCGEENMRLGWEDNEGEPYDERNYDVEVLTLDFWWNQYADGRDNLNEIGLIKIDTEGTEQDVLAGAQEIIMKYHPVIVAERVTAKQFAETHGFLRTYGYIHIGGSLTDTAPTYMWRPA